MVGWMGAGGGNNPIDIYIDEISLSEAKLLLTRERSELPEPIETLI